MDKYEWLVGEYGLIWPVLAVLGLLAIPWLMSWAMAMGLL